MDGASVLIRLCDGRRADELPTSAFSDSKVSLTVHVHVYISFQFNRNLLLCNFQFGDLSLKVVSVNVSYLSGPA